MEGSTEWRDGEIGMEGSSLRKNAFQEGTLGCNLLVHHDVGLCACTTARRQVWALESCVLTCTLV